MAIVLDLYGNPVYLAKSEECTEPGGTETVWKKSEDEAGTASPASPASPQTKAPSPPPPRSSASHSAAVIGSSILVKGDIEGGEDLTVQGRVEGKVRLQKNHVSIGQGGFLKGDVHGKSVHVEGEVRGNLYGSQEVILRASGVVQGNIVSPRVTLENGSRFKGSIDMEGATAEQAPAKSASPGKVGEPSNRPDTAAKSGSDSAKGPDKATATGAG